MSGRGQAALAGRARRSRRRWKRAVGWRRPMPTSSATIEARLAAGQRPRLPSSARSSSGLGLRPGWGQDRLRNGAGRCSPRPQVKFRHRAGGLGDPQQGAEARQGAAALEAGDERLRGRHARGELGLAQAGVHPGGDDRARDRVFGRLLARKPGARPARRGAPREAGSASCQALSCSDGSEDVGLLYIVFDMNSSIGRARIYRFSALVRSPSGGLPPAAIAASRLLMPARVGRSKRRVMSLRIEVVS